MISRQIIPQTQKGYIAINMAFSAAKKSKLLRIVIEKPASGFFCYKGITTRWWRQNFCIHANDKDLSVTRLDQPGAKAVVTVWPVGSGRQDDLANEIRPKRSDLA